jgi:hypothetical protein
MQAPSPRLPPLPGFRRRHTALAGKECRVQNRKQGGNDEVGVTVDGVDPPSHGFGAASAVDGVDLNGSARTPAQPPPFDTPTLRALSSSLRKE